MHGRFKIGGTKPVLFAFIDDHSRLIPGWRWGFSEDTIRLEAALRAGLESRGVPASVYVDYADVRVMPTFLWRPWPAVVEAAELSA